MSARGSRVRALSIAGTDPTGGAGVQADLKAFAAHGAYGMAVVTALVAQNTRGVRAVHVPDVEFLRAQLDAVGDDVEIDALKIGMLADATVAGTVASWLDRVRPPVVVLDPVMVATSGDMLLDPAAQDAVRALAARADLVTPNLPELAVLLGEERATTWPQALRQAMRLSAALGAAVLVKGGHLDGATSPDALIEDGAVVELHAPRVPSSSTHGTGGALSAALAALRPARASWTDAAREAKAWLTGAIAAGEALRVGGGHGPVDHFHHAPQLGARPFSDEAWAAVADLRDECDAVPFVRGLADGSLPAGTFEGYAGQDALYLGEYARVLARASSLARSLEAQTFYARGAHDCVVIEAQRHRDVVGAAQAVASDVTRAYVDHLLGVAATGSYAEVVAAVLPCYWLYADLGTRMLRAAGPDHPYAGWIGLYGGDDFVARAARARAFADEAAREAGPATRARMLDAFVTSFRHELAFFAQKVPEPVAV